MFDHVKFGASDYTASKAFFLQALAPLSAMLVSEDELIYGVEPAGSGDAFSCLYQSAEKPTPLHITFRADSREQVGVFWQVALAAGGKDNGVPGVRPSYHAGYYVAFVIAPDGHNIEAACHLAGQVEQKKIPTSVGNAEGMDVSGSADRLNEGGQQSGEVGM